ncbi:MAG: Rib/alpha-like domain-containing protein [Peptoniphilaceae bacterium]
MKRLNSFILTLLLTFSILTNSLMAQGYYENEVSISNYEGDKIEELTSAGGSELTLEEEWTYFDGEEDPGINEDYYYSWATYKFSDRVSPKKAKAPFGAKKGEAYNKNEFSSNTTLNQYKSNGDDIPAYFFINKFNAKEVGLKDLEFTIHYDDAAIVYINGEEVWMGNTDNSYSSNMEYGALRAGGSPNKETVTINFDKLKDVLKEGENIIGVELHQANETSSDIYFNLFDLKLKDAKLPEENEYRYPIMTIGATENERNFTWYSGSKEQGYFEITKASDSNFENSRIIEGKTNENNNTSIYSNSQVEIKNLEENTEYIYRFWNGNLNKSKVYNFKTQGPKDFSFFLLGDPQMGAGSLSRDLEGWDKSLKKMKEINPNSSFLLSAGDQVNISRDEEQYSAFIERPDLEGLTLATVIGNHDSSNNAYSQHFSLPNVQNEGATNAGSNYYFVYNNTLFIDINSNNRSIAEHKKTIEDAKEFAKNKDIKWTILTFHHSIYSVASHANDWDILNRRNDIAPLVKEYNIDAVLMGHDHVYVRSHLMDGTEPIIEYKENNEVPSEYKDPKGALYLTANSASGSKFYKIQNQKFPYSAVQNQEKTPNFTNIEVTDNSFKATTYRSTDGSVVDEVTLIKSSTEKDADKYSPEGKDIEIKENGVVNPSDLISNKEDLPEGTSYKFANSVDTSEVGEKAVKVIVTYPDNSTDELEAKITIVKVVVEEKDADKYSPEGKDIEIKENGVVNPSDLISNKEDLPEGTSYKFANSVDTSEAGEKTVRVIVTYPDSSTDELEAKITIRKTSRDNGSKDGYIIFPKSNSKDVESKDIDKLSKEIIEKYSNKNITDISGHWAEKVIIEVVNKKIMDLDNNKFNPDEATTRIDVVKALARIEKINPKEYKGSSLNDIEANSEESGYINWAIKNNIIDGYEDGSFRSQNNITREEIAKILNQYVINLKKNYPLTKEIYFKDEEDISNWAKKDVKEATKRGLLKGRANGDYDPKANLSRAEVAQIIKNILDK